MSMLSRGRCVDPPSSPEPAGPFGEGSSHTGDDINGDTYIDGKPQSIKHEVVWVEGVHRLRSDGDEVAEGFKGLKTETPQHLTSRWISSWSYCRTLCAKL